MVSDFGVATPRQSGRLWLVRHAQPVVGPGLCYGQSDLLADPAATQVAAQRLSAALPRGAAIYMSGLQRAQQLAWAMHSMRPDLAHPQADHRLNEIDFGEWELTDWQSIPKTQIDAWVADFAHFRFGGRESVADLLQRVSAALRTMPWHGRADVVWVTHAGVIRAVQYLQAHPTGIPRADEWPTQAPACGEWLLLEGVYS